MYRTLFQPCPLVLLSFILGFTHLSTAHSELVTKANKPLSVTLNTKTGSEAKKIYFGHLTITPGGFLASEGFWRSRNIMSDIASNFANIPTLNLPQAYISESRLTARQTRIAALIESKINAHAGISSYVETDFLGNGSANSIKSNSYDLRIRQLYADIDWNLSRWHITVGQLWSLITPNSDWLKLRNELPPPTIDAQFVVGFLWKRQPQIRISKELNPYFSMAISIENPQTTFGGTPFCAPAPNGVKAGFNDVNTIFCTAPGVLSLPEANNFSFNSIPDVIAKLVYQFAVNDRKIHLEAFGLYRDFYDRVYYNHINSLDKQNKHTPGISGGGSAFITVIPNKLDLQGNVLIGHGIGSYAAGTLPDVTFASNGALKPIKELAIMGGFIVHTSPTLDFYLFGGEERQKAAYFYASNRNSVYGLGTPTANTSGCQIEGGICDANTQTLWQISSGVWKKLFEGAFGQLKLGLQYSYTQKILFPGTNNPANDQSNGNYIKGRTNDHMIFASIRYYPFAASPHSSTK